jgi:hypothetical protein
MFEKTSKLAEEMATSASRRGFLGSLGRWAGTTAMALAGVLTTAGTARAGGGHRCCYYYTADFYSRLCGTQCIRASDSCPTNAPASCPANAYLSHSSPVSGCGQCN